MTGTPVVDILLATWNGAQYLPEQIDSLLAQSCADWHLLARDDGSTDGTVELLTQYVTAQAVVDEPIRWILIGKGQEESKIQNLLAEARAQVEWIGWVDYDRLQDEIARADVCLGIFGDTDKAARVIPNKVFQIISCGAPLITRDSPAIRELLSPDMPGVYLVPPGDLDALLEAVHQFAAGRAHLPTRPMHSQVIAEATLPAVIGRKYLEQTIWKVARGMGE